MNTYVRAVWVQLRKEITLEWRSKDAINAMLFLALLIVVVFSLAVDPTRAVARQIAGGIVCVAVLFAATNALNQAWTREIRGGVLDALRMAPIPASSIFLGKAIANFLVISAIEAVLAPLFTIFYNLSPQGHASLLFAVLPLGTWAIVGNGIFFAALSLRTRSRELLLPLLLFPISIPALLGLASSITAIFSGESDPIIWIKMLAGYDIAFTTVAILLFGTILNAEG